MAFPFIIPGVSYSDGLTILGISVLTAVICEAISWLFIYRSASYKSLRSMKLLTVRSKESSSPSSDDANGDLSRRKFKSGAVTALVMYMVFRFLSFFFDGKPVAKLPFVPFTIVQKMSHRGLSGDDMTDCSMVFLNLLCSMSIRKNLKKLLGFAPPRSPLPIPDKEKTD